MLFFVVLSAALPVRDVAIRAPDAEAAQALAREALSVYDIHGNVSEWVLDHYDPAYYKQFAGKVADRPVLLPDAKEYPYVARGGSYDDDPEALRSAARKGSDKEWSMQDPQRPQSIWWHTEAHWVGIRLVRPLQEQDNLKDLKSPIVKRGATK